MLQGRLAWRCHPGAHGLLTIVKPTYLKHKQDHDRSCTIEENFFNSKHCHHVCFMIVEWCCALTAGFVLSSCRTHVCPLFHAPLCFSKLHDSDDVYDYELCCLLSTLQRLAALVLVISTFGLTECCRCVLNFERHQKAKLLFYFAFHFSLAEAGRAPPPLPGHPQPFLFF